MGPNAFFPFVFHNKPYKKGELYASLYIDSPLNVTIVLHKNGLPGSVPYEYRKDIQEGLLPGFLSMAVDIPES